MMDLPVQVERDRCELEILRWRSRNLTYNSILWDSIGELAELIRKGETSEPTRKCPD